MGWGDRNVGARFEMGIKGKSEGEKQNDGVR
jgi:hypothetical protein